MVSFATLLSFAAVACAQVSDYPGASDFHTIARPAGSVIIGGMHIDNDEYEIPLGPVEWNADHLGKSMTATGPIDTLVYAGPTTASSLTTYTNLATQLTTNGYTLVWGCVRKTCGSAFHLANILDKPVIAAVKGEGFGIEINNDLNATNDDIRYGTFRRGDEYVLVMGSLGPGKPSGALLIRVNGPANDPVFRSEGAAAAAEVTTPPPANAAADAAPGTATPRTRVRAAARNLFNRAP